MLLEKICKELGVEIGEKWLANDGYYYKITEDGMIGFYFPTSDYEKSFDIDPQLWVNLVSGELKPKWKPEYEETYYVPVPNALIGEYRAESSTWVDDSYDEWALENNLVFKTKEDAIKAANKMLAALKED